MATVTLLVFLVGLCVGSFLNVIVLRTASGQSMGGRSRCPHCETTLGVVDLVPVASYLILRGRCRHCGMAISAQYPIVEFVTGLLFAAFFLRYWYGFSLPEHLTAATSIAYLLRDLVITGFLVVLFVFDFRYYLILDRFTVPAIIFAFVVNGYLGLPVSEMLLGAGVIGGFFLIQHLLSRGAWIGGGDVRMGVLMGFVLGFTQGLAALFIAYAAGAVIGLTLLASQKADWKTQVPFGTFLALATLIMLFCGDAVTSWYLSLLGFPGSALSIPEVSTAFPWWF